MYEIKPDLRSAMLFKGGKILVPILALLGLYGLWEISGMGEMIAEAQYAFGSIFLGFTGLLKITITMAVIAVAGILFLAYYNASRQRYTFLDDGIVVYGKSLGKEGKDIPYMNISRVTMEKYPLMKTGKIKLELSGLEDKEIELEFVKNPAGIVKYIEGMKGQ